MEHESIEEIQEKYGTLENRLEHVLEEFKNSAPDEVMELITESIRNWKASEILNEAVKVGDVMPDFALPDHTGELVSSVDLRAKGPIVIVFFRGSWCGWCNETLRMIRKYSPHFKAHGATVVAISPQTIEKTAEIVKGSGLNFPVLSDKMSEYAQLLKIAFVMEEHIQEMYKNKMATRQPEYNGDDSYFLPIPATYVVDTDGKVTYSFLETDFRKRAEPVDILNALPRLPSKRKQSLDQKIEIEMGKILDKLPEGKMKTLFEEVERLKASGVESGALKVGEKAPDFKLPDRNGQVVLSKKLRKKGSLVVTFNHGHKSPLCMIQLEAMQNHYAKFEAKGANVVAISPSGSKDMFQAIANSGTKFPLLSDLENDPVIKEFRLQHQLPSDIFGGKGGKVELPMAATYVIDRSGSVAYSFATVDPTKRAEPVDILKAIPTKEQPRQALKFGPFSLFFGARIAPRETTAVR